MNQQQDGDQRGEYRGQAFLIQTRHEGEVWIGHFRLLGLSDEQASDAMEQGQHRWTPLDPGWATENEARTNATEATHAAIDALMAGHRR